ncbi:uncharacterized protein [Nicotiana tomentosiformis]|uniref:uncharacterized protein n=1 Tax=Nicotiana tomentosiformis TaxID=4098 RepID=UPI00388C4DB5
MACPDHRGASTSHGSYSDRSGQSSLSALPAQSSSLSPSVQVSSAPGSSGSYSGSRGPPHYFPPFSERGCFKCRELGHMKRHCPRLSGGPNQQRSQATTFAPVTLPPTQPARGGAQTTRGRPRGGGRLGGGQARFCAILTRPKAIALDTMITSIVSICHRDAYILFDPDSTYLYVSSYFARYLDMPFYCDASQIGIRCILMQEGRVIAYASHQLKPYEKNYPGRPMW